MDTGDLPSQLPSFAANVRDFFYHFDALARVDL